MKCERLVSEVYNPAIFVVLRNPYQWYKHFACNLSLGSLVPNEYWMCDSLLKLPAFSPGKLTTAIRNRNGSLQLPRQRSTIEDTCTLTGDSCKDRDQTKSFAHRGRV